eukprot:m.308213 g.308213  ORF g.308213 m.308213 type:complete len:123 (-) comp15939_c3_seq6:203-571(-)
MKKLDTVHASGSEEVKVTLQAKAIPGLCIDIQDSAILNLDSTVGIITGDLVIISSSTSMALRTLQLGGNIVTGSVYVVYRGNQQHIGTLTFPLLSKLFGSIDVYSASNVDSVRYIQSRYTLK